MANTPLVSIIISSYNYDRFLSEAIDSALQQTYPHREVIVVDDGSSDDSRKIIARYGKQIIPVLKANGGQSSALNAGFAVSRGEIICLLDADDTFLPSKVAEVVNFFEKYEDIGWCFHLLQMIGTNDKNCFNIRHYNSSAIWDFRDKISKGEKLPFIPCATSGLSFRRGLLQQIFPIPESITITSDNYLKYTCLALSRGFFYSRELAIQKVHANNAYTLRLDKQNLRVKILLFTAYWIRAKFPTLSKFTNGLFIMGIGTSWRTGYLEPECQEIVAHYFDSIGFLEKLRINLGACFFLLRNYIGLVGR